MISTSLRGQLLEDGEHQLLLAHGAGVLDLQLFGEGEQLGRRLRLEILKLDFPHGDVLGGARDGPGGRVGEENGDASRRFRSAGPGSMLS